MASKRPFSNRSFIDCVRDYLPTDAIVHETDAEGHAGAPISHDDLAANTFYRFDAEALNAFFHAITELALEEASGTLLLAARDQAEFDSCRECLAQLARTIDRVELVGARLGTRSLRGVTIIRDSRGGCRDFRVVLYEGRRTQAMLVCREAKPARSRARTGLVGFYTLDSPLVRQLHAELVDVAQGRAVALRGFVRLQAIDLAARQLQREFEREQQALHTAVRRLQFDPQHYRPAQFASDLEQGLCRLQEWKRRLPEMVTRAEAS